MLACHPPSQGLYCDIRQLVQFIKEAHGNVFRRVALSALLDSAEKVTATKKPDEKDETKLQGPKRYWKKKEKKMNSHPLLTISSLLALLSVLLAFVPLAWGEMVRVHVFALDKTQTGSLH